MVDLDQIIHDILLGTSKHQDGYGLPELCSHLALRDIQNTFCLSLIDPVITKYDFLCFSAYLTFLSTIYSMKTWSVSRKVKFLLKIYYLMLFVTC